MAPRTLKTVPAFPTYHSMKAKKREDLLEYDKKNLALPPGAIQQITLI